MQPKTSADRRFTILLTTQFLLLVLVLSLLWKNFTPTSKHSTSSLPWREVGSQLQGAGVTSEAIVAYEKAIQEENLDDEQKAAIAYSIAELYNETGEWSRALSWYYQVLQIHPDFTHKSDVNQKTVVMLERLKKFSAVKRTLADNTSFDTDKEKKEPSQAGVVVAQVGEEKIYLHQIQNAFDQLPPFVKESFKGEQGLQLFAKKYVADQLLYAKAQRLGYEKSGEFQKQLRQLEKDLLVQKVLQEEVLQKVVVNESDLQNFFKANSERYLDPQNKKVPVDLKKVRPQVEQDYRVQQQQQRYQQLIDETLKAQEVQLFLDRVK